MLAEKVEIGFDLPSSSGNFFTLDSATKGKLDNTTYKLSGVIFYDVTSRVKQYTVRRGKSRQLENFNAGIATVTFDNRDRAFDPTFAASPYYGQIIPKREIRITTNPSFVAGSTVTNLVTNPSFEVSISGWFTAGSTTLARTVADAYLGAACLQLTTPALNDWAYSQITVSASTTYTASAYVKPAVGKTVTIAIIERAGVSIVGTSTSTTITGNGSWQRVSVTRALGATATNVWLQIQNKTASASVILADAVMLTATTSAVDYFDGSTRSIDEWTAYSWSGTAGLSTSSKVVTAHATGRRYTGLVDDWNLDYSVSGESSASVSASDAFSRLANQTLTGGTATPQLSGARISAVLDSSDVQWPAEARSIDSGTVSLGADVQAADSSVLEYLQLVEATELGNFYVDKSGNLVFKDANSLIPRSGSVTVFSDDDSGIPYSTMQVVYGSELLHNQVVASSVSASGTVQADKLQSQADYGIYTYARSDLLMSTIGAVEDYATAVVRKYANPEYRFEALTIALHTLTEAQVSQVLALELGSLCQIVFTPNGVAPAISKYASVISIAESVDTVRHNVTLGFATVDYASFILDDVVFGRLDSGQLG